MKKRFKSNLAETCGDGAVNVPKKELIARAKQEIKHNKARLKTCKKYMNTLKDMTSDYDYHQESLNTLVGNVCMQIDRLEGYIEQTEDILAKLKGAK